MEDNALIEKVMEKTIRDMMSPAARMELLKRKPYLSEREVAELTGIA